MCAAEERYIYEEGYIYEVVATKASTKAKLHVHRIFIPHWSARTAYKRESDFSGFPPMQSGQCVRARAHTLSVPP